jgi:hypothetical protein
MRSDAIQVLVLAVAVGLSSAALTTATRAQTEPPLMSPAAAYRIVDECGQRFVELAPQAEPRTFRWGEFGEPVASYMGVVAYAHGREGDPRRENAQGLYQCTELAHRYLRDVFGVPTRIGLGLGHGVDLARKVAERFEGRTFVGGLTGDMPVHLQYFANGTSACRPTVGSVVSIAMPMPDGEATPGHVAIVRDLEFDGLALDATLFEQHGGAALMPGDNVPAGRIRFERIDGAWVGAFQSGAGQSFPVEGWTSVVAP